MYKVSKSEHSRNWRYKNIPEAQNSMARERERMTGSKADNGKRYSKLKVSEALPKIFILS